jgi:hypothetical protein
MRNFLTFGDLEGKLDVLRVECSRCQRKGRYSVAKLIEKYGRRGNMMKWKEQLNGDCPKRDAHELHRPLRSHQSRSAKGAVTVACHRSRSRSGRRGVAHA